MNMSAARDFVSSVNRQNFTLLGEVISWNLQENTVVAFQDLVSYLRAAGLDENVAREMRPRHAFARAAKQLASDRIIRCVEDKPHMMRFQFTKEVRDVKLFDYKYETVLVLDKDTGNIQSEDGNSLVLVNEATRLLNKAKDERLTADISRYIMTLFEREADLFPVRNAGGVYFVPDNHAAFVDKIETFVTAVGGNVTRFPVPAGTKQGDKSVKEAVQNGIKTLIDEHLKAVEDFGTDTRPSTLERQYQKIEETKFKIEAYALYLDDQKDALNANLATTELNLRQKTEQILKFREQAKKGQ